MLRKRCCICARYAKEKKGKVHLCQKHVERYLWDKDYGYLRQKKTKGKWKGIWR